MTAANRVLRPERLVRTFPGTPDSVERARGFVSATLAGCPARDTLVTCASELCTNAINHTRSGAGGVFTVEILRPADGIARVAVTDSGGASIPVVWGMPTAAGSDLGESGRGLALVAALTSRWGHRVLPDGGRIVWAEATWPVPVPAY